MSFKIGGFNILEMQGKNDAVAFNASKLFQTPQDNYLK